MKLIYLCCAVCCRREESVSLSDSAEGSAELAQITKRRSERKLVCQKVFCARTRNFFSPSSAPWSSSLSSYPSLRPREQRSMVMKMYDGDAKFNKHFLN
jgi:hypothetical protein